MTAEEKIAKMYEDQLKLQKDQLQLDHDTANADLDKVKEQNQATTDQNVVQTQMDNQRAKMADAEYAAASGLTSGAKAQARLARENQLSANVAALRTAQQESDAEVERERALLAAQYASAIQQAQAENDLAKAQALYEQAEKEEAALLAQQQAEAEALLAQEKQEYERRLEAAKYLAEEVGDYSAIAEIYGYTDEQKKTLGIETGYDRVYENGEDGKPIGITGHGLLSATGKTAIFKASTLSGKTANTEQSVMMAEDGSLWYWNPMQNKYVSFVTG